MYEKIMLEDENGDPVEISKKEFAILQHTINALKTYIDKKFEEIQPNKSGGTE